MPVPIAGTGNNSSNDIVRHWISLLVTTGHRDPMAAFSIMCKYAL
jgi:hypothetical protein